MANKHNNVVDEWADFLSPAGADRVRIRFEVVPGVVAWLLLHWNRIAASVPEMPPDPTDEQMMYVANCRKAAEQKMIVIQELVNQATDTFRVGAWEEAALMTGLMIRAADDAGLPLHKLGKAFQKAGFLTNGTSEG